MMELGELLGVADFDRPTGAGIDTQLGGARDGDSKRTCPSRPRVSPRAGQIRRDW
jgi:hypothetical protein